MNRKEKRKEIKKTCGFTSDSKKIDFIQHEYPYFMEMIDAQMAIDQWNHDDGCSSVLCEMIFDYMSATIGEIQLRVSRDLIYTKE